jgi:integration host factor subunit alpha
MAFTKNDMVHAIYTRLDLPKHKSEEVVESLLEIMKRTQTSGEDVLISGFGKFSVKEKRERMGRNPETGKKMLLRARRIVTFTTSGILRGRINGKV